MYVRCCVLEYNEYIWHIQAIHDEWVWMHFSKSFLFPLFSLQRLQHSASVLRIWKSAWMEWRTSNAWHQAIRPHRCFGRAKVPRCWCSQTILMAIRMSWPMAHCKYVAFRRMMLDILFAQRWVWLDRRRHVHFCKSPRSMIYRRQSFKLAQPIKHCRLARWPCCRVEPLAHHRRASAGIKMGAHCKQASALSLCKMDFWKLTVSLFVSELLYDQIYI